MDALKNVDGLIGVVPRQDEPRDSHDRSSPSEISDTDRSDIELRPVRDKGVYASVEEEAPVRLALGAIGSITRRRRDAPAEP
jgi:hypothetical protein